MKLLLLIFRNLRRSWLRTVLTALGTVVLVLVVTMAWSFLALFDAITKEKSQNFKAIVTERWQIPSQLPFSYASSLEEGASRNPGDIRPTDSMTWSFFGGSIDPSVRSFENIVFAFALEPKKLATMMDGLDDLEGADKQQLAEAIARLEATRTGIILGQDRAARLNKRVGERITIFGFGGFKDLNLEVEVVGIFPPGRYDQAAAINRDYLNEALDAYPRDHKGMEHPMQGKSLNLVWLRVPDRESFERLADQVVDSPLYSNPAVKMETASSGIASFLEAYRDIFWGVRWILTPAIIFTLALVLANAISISVRERRLEVAILKVLGFRPGHILLLVLGEALAIGALAGAGSAAAAYLLINNVLGGVKFPIAFIPSFTIPAAALWWGLAVGSGTALAGSLWPAWTACRVKVSEVFAKVD